jgi:hypothetical protein
MGPPLWLLTMPSGSWRYGICDPPRWCSNNSVVGKYEHDFEAPPIIPSSAESIPDLQHRTGSIPSAEGSYNPWNTNDERNLGGGDKGTEGNIAEQTSVRGMVDACTSGRAELAARIADDGRLPNAQEHRFQSGRELQIALDRRKGPW